MMRMHSITAFLAMLSLLVVASTAVAGWGNGSVQKDDGKTTCTCGDLDCDVGGAFGSWPAPTGAGSSSVTTTGDVGVKWKVGSEPNTGSQLPAPQTKKNYSAHQYTYVSGASAINCGMKLTAVVSFGGTAGAKNTPPPPWSWTWSGKVDQNDPTYVLWTSGTGWGSPKSAPPASVTSDTNGTISGGHTGQTGGVTGAGMAGSYVASWILLPGTATKIQYNATFDSEATAASCTNTSILTDNFLKLSFTFITGV